MASRDAGTNLPANAEAVAKAVVNGDIYSAPELTEYGSLQALTATGSRTSVENANMMLTMG